MPARRIAVCIDWQEVIKFPALSAVVARPVSNYDTTHALEVWFRHMSDITK